jgi:hypothetical protein
VHGVRIEGQVAEAGQTFEQHVDAPSGSRAIGRFPRLRAVCGRCRATPAPPAPCRPTSRWERRSRHPGLRLRGGAAGHRIAPSVGWLIVHIHKPKAHTM